IATTAYRPIVLAANASDPDGSVVTVEYFVGTNSIGVGWPAFSPPNPTINVSNVLVLNSGLAINSALLLPPLPPFGIYWFPEAGEYVVTAKATDNEGATATSAPVHLTILGPPVVTVEATDAHASEPGSGTTDQGAFTIRRTGSTNNSLQVYLFLS